MTASGDLLAEVLLGGVLHLLEDHGGDLGRRVLLPRDLDARVAVGGLHHLVGDHLGLFAHLGELAPHEPLDGVDRVLRVRDGLPLGHLPHQPLARLGEGHDRRRGPRPFRIRDDGRAVAFHHRHDGIRGTQVDADRLAQESPPLSKLEIELSIVNPFAPMLLSN
jgi:hypothetical protein